MHESITLDRVIEAIEAELMTLENPGFCLHCGAESDGCEPDAEGYPCEVCGASAVMGAALVGICYF